MSTDDPWSLTARTTRFAARLPHFIVTGESAGHSVLLTGNGAGHATCHRG